MGALIAVLDKRGEDATEKALMMLKTLNAEKAEAVGMASPSIIRIGKTFDKLRAQKMNSPIIVGHLFSKIADSDKPQPTKLERAALVFEGRIYPPHKEVSDAEVPAKRLTCSLKRALIALVKEASGDFAFAIAEPKRLIASRDSLGIRPLYYGEDAHVVALASERKALWKIGINKTESFPPGHVASIEKTGITLTRIKTLSCSNPRRITMQTAAKELQTLLQQSTKERISELKEVAVAFSGGLDSSIIAFLAKKTNANTHLIHVSLENQPETEYAKRTAEELKLPIHVHLFKEDDAMRVLPKVLWLIEESDPIKTSIGIPIYWTAEKAAEMKFKVMLAGQGADEFFGGYRRYVDYYLQYGAKKTREYISRDIVTIHETNLERDFKICNFHNVELRLPFVNYEIAKLAMDLPINLKIEIQLDGLRKLVLRQAAKNLGLPDSVLEKPKKAIQYTTGIDKTLKKLAKKKGKSVGEFLDETFQETVKKMM
jgi:asparagine synthase (glutamine-hydrolysing)